MTLLVFIFIARFFNLWVRSIACGARLGLFDLIGMRLRKVDAGAIVRAKIMAVQAGLPVDTNQLQAHYLAGVNVLNVVQALIAAHRMNIKFDFKDAQTIDLAGRDVLAAVDKMAQADITDANTLVRVLAIEGDNIIVRKAD
jgi:uncharacterized protein YqfA (UPF0365 family)